MRGKQTADLVTNWLPQKGRAKVVDVIQQSTANGFVVRKFLGSSKENHLYDFPSQSVGLIQTAAINDRKIYVQFSPEDEIFEGHFPDKPLAPGHELIGLMIKCAESAIRQPLVVERVSALFKAPVLPRETICINLEAVTVERKKVSFRAKAFNMQTGAQVCALNVFEGRIEEYNLSCSPHKLIEMACQAATLLQIRNCGGKINPIALTAIEAVFMKRMPVPGIANISVYDSEVKRGGICSCKADITDDYGRVVVLVEKLNGVPIDRLTM